MATPTQQTKSHRRRERVRVRVRRRRSRSTLRRGIGTAILLILASLVIVGILAVFAAIPARTHLQAARASMLDARSALLQGDPEAARGAFEEAHSQLREAQGRLENPAIRFFGFLPLIGRSPDATKALVEAGLRVSQAGKVVSHAVETLPGGVSALAPRDGRIPLQPLRQLAVPLSRVDELLEEAGAFMDASPRTLLIPPVRRAVAEFAPLVEEARRGAASASALTRGLPHFLGAEGTRRYFVGAQNPAEERGTGGLIGAYAILTVRDGRLHFGDFRSVSELDTLPVKRLKPPNPDYAARFDRFQSSGYWSNINMTPDFPSAAVAIERLYQATEGVELDGAILVDPFAFSTLLDVTGPVQVPDSGYELTSKNVVDYVTNQAYRDLPGSERKLLLGDAAEEVLSRFIGGPVGSKTTEEDLHPERIRSEGGDRQGDGGRASAPRGSQPPVEGGDQESSQATPGGLDAILGGEGEPTVAAGRALVETAAGGHLLFHSADPQEERVFRTAGIAGELDAEDGDFLGVVSNNAAGNKIDFYMDRAVTYRVHLDDQGAAVGEATVRFTNKAPRTGQPSYVIGPHPFVSDAQAGESIAYLSTYCAPSCSAQNLRRDGELEGAIREQEQGYRVLSTEVRLPSGTSQTIDYEWSVDDVWEGGPGGGTYRLTFMGQTTIRPTRLRLDIAVPDGAHITALSPGMDIIGNRAVWEGKAENQMVFEVSFARGPFGTVWHGLLDFLQRPLLE